MVFVTVGSQKFQFDRLIKAVDELAQSGVINDSVFAQTGVCEYEPQFIDYKPFLDRETFQEKMTCAGLVITHAGTGAIIGALKAGKKVIAVPRLCKYEEHVDDHQCEIVQRFADMGLIEPCLDASNLASAYRRARERTYQPYESNTQRFLSDLRGYIDSIEAE